MNLDFNLLTARGYLQSQTFPRQQVPNELRIKINLDFNFATLKAHIEAGQPTLLTVCFFLPDAEVMKMAPPAVMEHSMMFKAQYFLFGCFPDIVQTFDMLLFVPEL